MGAGKGRERSEVLKTEGGKLLKVTVWSEGGTIKDVRISGDFFVHPEEAVESMEERLRGMPAAMVRGVVMEELATGAARAIGFNLEDLINMIERCAK